MPDPDPDPAPRLSDERLAEPDICDWWERRAGEYHPEDKLRELIAEVRRLREALAWRPIDTAPRDGTDILAAQPSAHGEWRLFVASWFDARWWDEGEPAAPTHWQPLPVPPGGTP